MGHNTCQYHLEGGTLCGADSSWNVYTSFCLDPEHVGGNKDNPNVPEWIPPVLCHTGEFQIRRTPDGTQAHCSTCGNEVHPFDDEQDRLDTGPGNWCGDYGDIS